MLVLEGPTAESMTLNDVQTSSSIPSPLLLFFQQAFAHTTTISVNDYLDSVHKHS